MRLSTRSRHASNLPMQVSHSTDCASGEQVAGHSLPTAQLRRATPGHTRTSQDARCREQCGIRHTVCT
jgi:hypothetical protein